MKLLTVYISVTVLLFQVLCVVSKTTVTTKWAEIVGSEKTVLDKRVNVFLGIPYAKPPVGELRFKKPVPLDTISGKQFEANKWPNMCSQTNIFGPLEMLSEVKAYSEDCLYLNVWSPLIESTEKLPVMIFIHGGAYIMGSSSLNFLYDGAALSVSGKVIVVTINYRLGAFGFLYTGSDDIPANLGFWDQNLALKWVKENIAAFGGNPNKITIFGESAGGFSVGAHMFSPHSWDLFDQIIQMSGVLSENESIYSTSTGLESAKIFAEFIGCKDDTDKNANRLSPKTIECILKTDTDKIVSITKDDRISKAQKGMKLMPCLPVFGDEFIPKSPRVALKEGFYKKNIPILIGTVIMDGSVVDLFAKVQGFKEPSDKEGFIDLLEQLTKTSSESLKHAMNEYIKVYFTGIPDNDYHLSKKAYLSILTDYYFHCPSVIHSQVYAKTNPVYNYVFTQDFGTDNTSPFFKVLKSFFSTPYGSGHGYDILFTFGTVALDNKDPVYRNLSVSFMEQLSDFAHNGNPGWPKLAALKDGTIIPFINEIRAPQAGKPNFRLDDRYFNCQLWKTLNGYSFLD